MKQPLGHKALLDYHAHVVGHVCLLLGKYYAAFSLLMGVLEEPFLFPMGFQNDDF